MGSAEMTGELNEISRVIGQQEANLAGLNRTFDQHVLDDDRRHGENLAALQDIRQDLRNLTEALAPVVASVKLMRPIVDAYQVSRWKAAGAISLASSMLIGIGWLVTSLAGEGIKWLAAHIK